MRIPKFRQDQFDAKTANLKLSKDNQLDCEWQGCIPEPSLSKHHPPVLIGRNCVRTSLATAIAIYLSSTPKRWQIQIRLFKKINLDCNRIQTSELVLSDREGRINFNSADARLVLLSAHLEMTLCTGRTPVRDTF